MSNVRWRLNKSDGADVNVKLRRNSAEASVGDGRITAAAPAHEGVTNEAKWEAKTGKQGMKVKKESLEKVNV